MVGLWHGLENTALPIFQHDAEVQAPSRHRPGLDDTGFEGATAHYCARGASVKAGHPFLLLEHRERDIDDCVATMRFVLKGSAIGESRALPYPAHVSRCRRVSLIRRGGGIASRRRANPNSWISGRASTGKRKYSHKRNVRDDAARNHGWGPQMDVRFGLYVAGRSPVKVEKRARRRCLLEMRLFAKLQLFAETRVPSWPGLLRRGFYCHDSPWP